MQAYSTPERETDPHALPDVEVFFMSYVQFMTAHSDSWMADLVRDNEHHEDGCWHYAAKDLEGWYWWSCFPGCLPDSDPTGPFETEAEALADAQDI